MKRKISLITTLLTAILVVTLVACSGQQSSSEPTKTEAHRTETADSKEVDSNYPIIINHAFGETVIEKNLNALLQFHGQIMT